MSTATITLVTLVLYQGVLLGVGFWAKSRTHDARDFFLAGRNVGPFVTAMSYGASSSSAWVLLGLTATFYSLGAKALWILPGVWAGYVAVWLFIGPGLRRTAGEKNLVTIVDYLALGTKGPVRKIIVWLAASMIIFSFSFYVAGQFQGAGIAFTSAFGLPMSLSVIIGASVVLLYTWLGGFWAVSITDAIQAGLMLLIAIILPIAAIIALGGPSEFWGALSAHAFNVTEGGSGPNSGPSSGPNSGLLAGIGFAIGSLGIGIGPVGQPQLLTRLMAIDTEADIKRGFIIALGWSIVVFSAMAILGLSARTLIAPEVGDAEGVFFALSHAVLPGVLAGVVLSAVLSAIMSTADSLLLIAGSAAALDLGLAKRFPNHALLISRLATVFLCVAAVILTLALPASIYGRVLFAWSALGAAFGPLIIAAAMGRPSRAGGVILAMLTGFVLTVVLYLQPNTPGDWAERVVPFALALGIALMMPKRPA